MKNKRKLIILSIVAILLIVVLSSASYAYFTTPGSTGSEETISSGTMALTFTDGPQINATNLAPGDYIEKTFSVTNTGTLATTYDVYLSEVVNTFVQKNDLVYEITSNDGGYNTVNQVVVPNQEAKIVDTYSIGVGATHHYTLKITYKLTNQIQNDNMGRGFTAKININEYNLNNTEKLLKLLDTSGNLVDKQMISSGVSDYYYNLANTSLTGTTNIYCNNGGIPRIENNQLIVTGLTVDTECKMSNDIADTINSKLSTSKTGIVMTNNQDNTARSSITNGKEIVLDLNGKNINSVGINETSTTWNKNHNVFSISGKLIINDLLGTGGVYTGKANRALETLENGYLIINGGSYSGRNAVYGSGSNSNIIINDGSFTTKLNATIILADSSSNSSIIINGGSIINNYNGSSLLVHHTGTSSNTITINAGNFISKGKNFDISGTNNITNIYGGNFEVTGSDTNINIDENSGTVNIIGDKATFDDNGQYLSGIYIHKDVRAQLIVNKTDSILNINGGTFETTYSASDGECDVMNNGGTVNILDGEFITSNDFNLYNREGTMNVNGGKYYSNNHANVYNRMATMYLHGGEFKSDININIMSIGGSLYIREGNYNGSIKIETRDGTDAGSENYICGGTFTNNGNDIVASDSTAFLKYKSSVIWTGKSSPTIGGSYSSIVSIDDTITCN